MGLKSLMIQWKEGLSSYQTQLQNLGFDSWSAQNVVNTSHSWPPLHSEDCWPDSAFTGLN